MNFTFDIAVFCIFILFCCVIAYQAIKDRKNKRIFNDSTRKQVPFCTFIKFIKFCDGVIIDYVETRRYTDGVTEQYIHLTPEVQEKLCISDRLFKNWKTS